MFLVKLSAFLTDRLVESLLLQCYGTSIWDETLYKAWSEIVTNLIPNIGLLETHLNNFCRICDADEVVLFERATFLVISHAQASDEEEKGRLSYSLLIPREHNTLILIDLKRLAILSNSSNFSAAKHRAIPRHGMSQLEIYSLYRCLYGKHVHYGDCIESSCPNGSHSFEYSECTTSL